MPARRSHTAVATRIQPNYMRAQLQLPHQQQLAIAAHSHAENPYAIDLPGFTVLAQRGVAPAPTGPAAAPLAAAGGMPLALEDAPPASPTAPATAASDAPAGTGVKRRNVTDMMDSLSERMRKPVRAAAAAAAATAKKDTPAAAATAKKATATATAKKKALKRPAAATAATANKDTPASNNAEATPVKTDPKKSPNSKKAATAGAKSTPPKAVAKALLKYPGIPTKKREPMRIGHVNVYTDVVKQGWRARPQGQRVDVNFSWKVDGPQSWKNLVQYLSDQKAA